MLRQDRVVIRSFQNLGISYTDQIPIKEVKTRIENATQPCEDLLTSMKL